MLGCGREHGRPSVRQAEASILCARRGVVGQQIDRVAARQSGNEFAQSRYVACIVIDPGDERDADDDLDPRSREELQVAQDAAVVDSRAASVYLCVHYLHIIQEEVCRAGCLQHQVGVRVTGSVHDAVNVKTTALLERSEQEPGLGERLSARKGHTTPGLVVKGGIAFDRAHQLVQPNCPTRALARSRRAAIDAGAAVAAAFRVGLDAVTAEGQRLRRTSADARAAPRTALWKIDLGRHVPPAFRVVAPPARERASLQENGSSDARSVMGGKPHYVEYTTCYRSISQYSAPKCV